MRLAERHAATTPPDLLLQRYLEDGYVIVDSVLTPTELAAIERELRPVLDATPPGRNDFEGFHSRRVYSLLAKAPATAVLCEHPLLLALLDQLLAPGFLLSAHLAIQIREHETAQGWHIDDGFYEQPKPRKALGVSAIWAIDAFTATNGATELVPGSHRWGANPATPAHEDLVKAAMPPGSLLLFQGHLVHRGGGNEDGVWRLGVTTQFCEPWLRQQENMMLSVGETAKGLSPRLQAMLGYSLHPPFMGHVGGMHPLRLIQENYDPKAQGDADRARRVLPGAHREPAGSAWASIKT